MLHHALVLLGALSQAPIVAVVPAALEGSDVCLVVQTTGSHLCAENLGARPQILLFSEPSVGFRAARVLAPGERALFAVPEALASTFRMEAFDGSSLSGPSTGSISLDELRLRDGDTVFGVLDATGLALVGVDDAAIATIPTGPSLYATLTHVPAPIPSADRRPATRRIEKRPLPPV